MSNESSEWQAIGEEAPAEACNHDDWKNLEAEPVRCTRAARWRREVACNCGAIHTVYRRCHEHRIQELEKKIEDKDVTISNLIQLARSYNHDIRTNTECVLTAQGIEQTPRDAGDDFWKWNNAGGDDDGAGRPS